MGGGGERKKKKWSGAQADPGSGNGGFARFVQERVFYHFHRSQVHCCSWSGEGLCQWLVSAGVMYSWPAHGR
jgi:hypothetical protein